MHIDGRAVYSCTTLAIDAEGRDITTIEGLEPFSQGLHPMSQAFWDNDAQQCGFCTPGFVMACTAYLDHEPNPTREGLENPLAVTSAAAEPTWASSRLCSHAAKTTKMKGGLA